jgi:hypothetical protein
MHHAPAVRLEERRQCSLAHPAGGVEVALEGVEPVLLGDAKEPAVQP